MEGEGPAPFRNFLYPPPALTQRVNTLPLRTLYRWQDLIARSWLHAVGRKKRHWCFHSPDSHDV